MNGDYIGALLIFALAVLAIVGAAWSKAGEIDYLVDLALIVDAEEDAVLRMANEDRIGPAQAAHIFRHQLDDPEAVERVIKEAS